MKKITTTFFSATLVILLASCSNNMPKETASGGDSLNTKNMAPKHGDAGDVKPAGAAPGWAPDIKPQMQAVIEKLESYGDKPIPELTAAEARKNHTPTDAVMDLIKQYNIEMPAPKCDTVGRDIPVAGGNVHARIYTPKEGSAPYPVIVYYHGGGFVIADLQVYNASAQVLCEKTGAVVVSVAYRLAPEHKFPTAHNDAFAAYKWVSENAGTFNGDSSKLAVAGESAGGNLALNVAIMARDKHVKMPKAILAVYPVANSDMNSESYTKNAAAKPLDKPSMAWFVKNYLNSQAEAKDPRISLVNANLKGLPPTILITDEIDPLQSEGMLLADKLKSAGVNVDSKNYDGVTHEFFGMGLVVPQAKDAEGFATDKLKSALK